MLESQSYLEPQEHELGIYHANTNSYVALQQHHHHLHHHQHHTSDTIASNYDQHHHQHHQHQADSAVSGQYLQQHQDDIQQDHDAQTFVAQQQQLEQQLQLEQQQQQHHHSHQQHQQASTTAATTNSNNHYPTFQFHSLTSSINSVGGAAHYHLDHHQHHQHQPFASWAHQHHQHHATSTHAHQQNAQQYALQNYNNGTGTAISTSACGQSGETDQQHHQHLVASKVGANQHHHHHHHHLEPEQHGYGSAHYHQAVAAAAVVASISSSRSTEGVSPIVKLDVGEPARLEEAGDAAGQAHTQLISVTAIKSRSSSSSASSSSLSSQSSSSRSSLSNSSSLAPIATNSQRPEVTAARQSKPRANGKADKAAVAATTSANGVHAPPPPPPPPPLGGQSGASVSSPATVGSALNKSRPVNVRASQRPEPNKTTVTRRSTKPTGTGLGRRPAASGYGTGHSVSSSLATIMIGGGNSNELSAYNKDADVEDTSTYIVVTDSKTGRTVQLTNEELIGFSARQLNKTVAGFPTAIIKELKQRRRRLKNRGYAQNCRHKRLDHKLKLEQQNSELRDENHRQSRLIGELHDRLHQCLTQISSLKCQLVSQSDTK